ncbi:hypothetical protein [Halorubrum sp. F4]|uniref:hypothetical protein n=1 Tax=Halorubrum sp. F4 TaxID=2989715 RepID=UPI002480D081|nr:hypothetical protein [Halorubrum sp. F4]
MYRDITPSRRQLLASGLAAGLTATAGCLELGGDTGSGDEAAETTLSVSLTGITGPLRDRYVHEHDTHDDRWDDQALAVTLNSTQYTTQHRKLFFASPDDPAYVRREGTYCQPGSVIVDEVSETHPVLRLFEADDTSETPVDARSRSIRT